MASASAPASDLAVQPTVPGSSVAVPPPAASTTEAVHLSAGATIREDPGLAAATTTAAAAAVFFVACIKFSFQARTSILLFLLFRFSVVHHRYAPCVRTRVLRGSLYTTVT